MSIRPVPGVRHPGYPRDSAPTAERLAHEEPLAFSHEHSQLYAALERAAQRAEIAGHDGMADGLRSLRRDVAREIADRECAYRLDPEEARSLTIRSLREEEERDGG